MKPINAKKSHNTADVTSDAPQLPTPKGYRQEGSIPFKKGNPGRPMGTISKHQSFLKAIGTKQASTLVEKFLKKANSGDRHALVFAMERIFPRVTIHNNVRVDLSKFNLNNIQGVSDACTHIIHIVARGEMSLENATKLVNLINWKQNINVDKLEYDVMTYIEESKGGGAVASLEGDPLITEEEFNISKNSKH